MTIQMYQVYRKSCLMSVQRYQVYRMSDTMSILINHIFRRSVVVSFQIYRWSVISSVQMDQIYSIRLSASTEIQQSCGLPDDPPFFYKYCLLPPCVYKLLLAVCQCKQSVPCFKAVPKMSLSLYCALSVCFCQPLSSL